VKETTVTPKRARRSVQSVDRALDLIEALVSAEGEVAITALATRTGLHVSTVHRLLATLLRRGYVRQNPETSRYYAGAKLATLSEGRSRFGELRLRARPLLRSLTEATRETANLVVLDDLQAVYIETMPSPQVVRLFTAVGNRTPLHATGAGKALLANLPAARRVERRLLELHELAVAVGRSRLDNGGERRGPRVADELRRGTTRADELRARLLRRAFSAAARDLTVLFHQREEAVEPARLGPAADARVRERGVRQLAHLGDPAP